MADGKGISNLRRIEELGKRHGERPPALFSCGQSVKAQAIPGRPSGRIDCVFADYRSAVDGFTVNKDWYTEQTYQFSSKKEDYWYSVVVQDGAIIVGEKDLSGWG